ncbi:hypothetical protein N7U66_04875 [Lacinutrix neustonica]|uniref:Lipoprotein n=1 Tax=Lacinutrix neustonica TaxID=2980107 RepID=A0A9E8MX47_9FLAO|nr:hypothetical protein [Lacinutrix neustonica]WAC02966.1 hypothetical protein N7U66_04875 [Lacinutrix neustonica]
MRRTLPIFLIFLLLSLSCKPHKDFQKITNINVEAYPTRNISLELDTLDKKVMSVWRNLTNDKKKDFRNKFKESRAERIKDIEADTSNMTRIYLTGKENHVIFEGKDRTDLTNLSDKYEEVDYYYESMDSIYKKIEIGILDRNTGNHKVKIIYPDLKRFAVLDLDTKYSSIHIYTSSIRPKLKIENGTLKNEIINDSIPAIPDSIEVLVEEGVYIFYEIPKRKHSW